MHTIAKSPTTTMRLSAFFRTFAYINNRTCLGADHCTEQLSSNPLSLRRLLHRLLACHIVCFGPQGTRCTIAGCIQRAGLSYSILLVPTWLSGPLRYSEYTFPAVRRQIDDFVVVQLSLLLLRDLTPLRNLVTLAMSASVVRMNSPDDKQIAILSVNDTTYAGVLSHVTTSQYSFFVVA